MPRTYCSFALIAFLLPAPSVLSAQNLLTWAPSTVSTEALSGTVTSMDIIVTSASALSNITVIVVPGLGSYISTSPSFFFSIPAGAPQHLRLQFQVPKGTSTSILDGTIHLVDGKRTIAHPLEIGRAHV